MLLQNLKSHQNAIPESEEKKLNLKILLYKAVPKTAFWGTALATEMLKQSQKRPFSPLHFKMCCHGRYKLWYFIFCNWNLINLRIKTRLTDITHMKKLLSCCVFQLPHWEAVPGVFTHAQPTQASMPSSQLENWKHQNLSESNNTCSRKTSWGQQSKEEILNYEAEWLGYYFTY